MPSRTRTIALIAVIVILLLVLALLLFNSLSNQPNATSVSSVQTDSVNAALTQIALSSATVGVGQTAIAAQTDVLNAARTQIAQEATETQVAKILADVGTLTAQPPITIPPTSQPTTVSVVVTAAPNTPPNTGDVVATYIALTAIAKPAVPAVTTPKPLREHQTRSIGTGDFQSTTFSDGMQSITATDLAKFYGNIQRISKDEAPNGCAMSVFDTDLLWYSSSGLTGIEINGQSIGTLSVPTGKHGYIVKSSIPIKRGDKVCQVGPATADYAIIFGDNMYEHYDSFCYRGNC